MNRTIKKALALLPEDNQTARGMVALNLGIAYFRLAAGEWAEVLRQNPARRGVARRLERLHASDLLPPAEGKDGRPQGEELPDGRP